MFSLCHDVGSASGVWLSGHEANPKERPGDLHEPANAQEKGCAMKYLLATLGWLFPAIAHAAAVAAPSLPAAYAIPAGAVSVGNGAQLATELAKAKPHDIVLRDGTYASTEHFTSSCGHRIYAQNQGRAVLTSGLTIGSETCGQGAVVRGLAFAITDAKKAVIPYYPMNANETSVIEIWGGARSVQLLDLTISGSKVVGTAIAARQPEGLQIKRVVASGFRSTGIYVDADKFGLTVAAPPVLEDLTISNVSRPVAKSSGGTSEACLWVGNTAKVSRIKVRNCAWTGVWTGTAVKNATFSDLDIDASANGIGLYLEHFTTNTTFQRLKIGPNLLLGAICEWADPAWNYKPACDGVILQDATVDTTCAGIYLDEGTRNTTARRTTFINQAKGAFATTNTSYNILKDTQGNDYSRMKPGAQVTFDENNPCH